MRSIYIYIYIYTYIYIYYVVYLYYLSLSLYRRVPRLSGLKTPRPLPRLSLRGLGATEAARTTADLRGISRAPLFRGSLIISLLYDNYVYIEPYLAKCLYE